VNLILFDPAELTRPLPADDPRARHLREVLRRGPQETFDCGLINGPRGRARLEREDATGLFLSFTWGEVPPPLPAITLLIGLPRPQTARKILQECATLGVASLCFFTTEKGERSYASSQLWARHEARRHLLVGVAQAFCTHVPTCTVVDSLATALASVDSCSTRVALDNYEATAALTQFPGGPLPAVLAIGAERGWSPAERDQLRASGCSLAHLGPRVLRSETACAVGLSLLKARLGLI